MRVPASSCIAVLPAAWPSLFDCLRHVRLQRLCWALALPWRAATRTRLLACRRPLRACVAAGLARANGVNFTELVLPPGETPHDTRYKIQGAGAHSITKGSGARGAAGAALPPLLHIGLYPQRDAPRAARARGNEHLANMARRVCRCLMLT